VVTEPHFEVASLADTEFGEFRSFRGSAPQGDSFHALGEGAMRLRAVSGPVLPWDFAIGPPRQPFGFSRGQNCRINWP
jgi:hypothetical protein